MTIPGDPQQRWWVEASGENQSLVNDLRPGLVTVIAFGPSGEAIIAGSGFVIASQGECASVMTATHVLLEGVHRIQTPRLKYAPSSLFVPKSHTQPSIEPKDLKILWAGSNNALMADVRYLEYNDSLDIACALITPQDTDADFLKPVSFPLSTEVPDVGEVVHMISLDNLKSSTDWQQDIRQIQIERGVSIRCGVVTGVYPNGYRQYLWPCFTTSIPAEPGMSGGLVVLPDPGRTIGACGVVCADFTPQEARNSFKECGESIVACAWPALGIRMPESVPVSKTTKRHSIHEFMRSGKMPVAVGGIENIEIVLHDNGDYSIRRG